jgi:glutamyl-tRNA synthetase
VTTVVDVIRGDVEFPCSAMDDFVAVKASGAPLFVLANVVDDIDMGITHVIRGEDLLPTTPRGVLVWQALAASGWTTDGSTSGGEPEPTPGLPVFAHLPMLVNAQRKKISKRRDKVAVEEYRDQGYLAAAFLNYLSLLGWSPPGGEELFDTAQAVGWFRLEDVNHSPAFFDVDKLTHINGEYIRALTTEEFVEASQPWLHGDRVPWPEANFDAGVFARMAPLVQERVATLGEVPGMVDFLFLDEPEIDEAAWAKAVDDDPLAVPILTAAIGAYEGLVTGWTSDALHTATQAVADGAGRKLGKAQAPVRVAVTGRRVGPPLFEALAVMGPDRALDRLRSAVRRAGGGDT